MRPEFKLPDEPWHDAEKLIAKVLKPANAEASVPPAQKELVCIPKKAICAIANSAWKAKSRMASQEGTGQAGEVLRRVRGDIERIWSILVEDLRVEITDHTGEAFDYGLPLKVVTTQPKPGTTKERVIETIKPTILWQGERIQMGEVVITTPA